VPALQAVGKAWPALLMAIPQVVGSGAQVQGGEPVVVELVYAGGKKPQQQHDGDEC